MMSHVIGTGSAPLLGAGDSCVDRVSAAQSSERIGSTFISSLYNVCQIEKGNKQISAQLGPTPHPFFKSDPGIPYSTKFSQVFNLANFQVLARMFQRKFLTHNTQFSSSDCKSVNGQHPGAKLPNPQGTLSKKIPSK